MTLIKYVLFIALAFSGFNCFALGGDEVRNGGGYIIRCDTNPDGVFINYFVDYWFGYRTAGVFDRTYLPPAFGSPKERVSLILNNLAKVYPQKAKVLQGYLESFEKDSVFVDDMAEQVTHDVPLKGWPSVNHSCVGQQMIVQSGPYTNVRYTIYTKLWKTLPTDQKAFAILHEILLRDYRGRFTTEDAGRRVQTDSWTLAYWSMNNKSADYLRNRIPDLSVMPEDLVFGD